MIRGNFLIKKCHKITMTVNFFELPPEAFHGKLPHPAYQLLKELRELKAETTNGIFKNESSSPKVEELVTDLSKGSIKSWSKYKDVQIIATALLRYLKSMNYNEALIPNDCFTVIKTMISMNDVERETKLCQSILEGLQLVKKSRYYLIGYLFEFLNFISSNSDKNHMDPQSLGAKFGPIVVSVDNQSDQDLSNQAVAFLIENYKKIFPSFTVNDSLICNDSDIKELLSSPINLSHIDLQIQKINFRHDHIIPFLPTCRHTSRPSYERPKRKPPPKPVTSTQLAVNMFDSTIIRLQPNDASKNFLTSVRQSVTKVNPLDFQEPEKYTPAQLMPSKPSPKQSKNSSSNIAPKAEAKPETKSVSHGAQPQSRNATVPPQKADSKQASNKPADDKPVGGIAARIKALGMGGPMGMPMGMPMGGPRPVAQRSSSEVVETSEPPACPPMGMPMGGGAPSRPPPKKEEDTQAEVCVPAGKMVVRQARRAGGRRPPTIPD
ncbi:hypothetical protein TRFO_25326 [Tritrichomonas foetus]|uniref:Rho-GAP domain-containing protein n=1 Tax=Tritrichomonas foetus TaxID=1144522 RepID=A0A1J4K6J0_9EUKA|nr:hypothetical protein TRFO_25326 [Tritrichomonas foetus]|eukprot:OHT06586.1 hypothetical protein TRFO_25326 [Tritrichomonas foetus]